MPRKDGYGRFENYERKIKPPFMISGDFESILVPDILVPEKNKYQKHVACIYGYKLICVDDKLGKHFQFYLGEDAV